MRIGIYYLSGNYGSIDTTMQTIQDGILLDDGFLDVSDLEGRGLILTRGVYTDIAEGRQAVAHGEIAIIKPEELANVGAVTVDGEVLLKRRGDGFELCVVSMLSKLSGEDGDEGPDEEFELD